MFQRLYKVFPFTINMNMFDMNMNMNMNMNSLCFTRILNHSLMNFLVLSNMSFDVVSESHTT